MMRRTEWKGEVKRYDPSGYGLQGEARKLSECRD